MTIATSPQSTYRVLPENPAPGSLEGVEAQQRPQPGFEPRQTGSRDRPRILVVDDDPTIRLIVSRTLELNGFEAIVCSDGADALQAFAASEPALVILDVRMPRVDGLTVCRELRSGSDVPILMLTGMDDQAAAASALDMGADDYVRKPFGVTELVARIRALLRRSTAELMPNVGVLSTGDVSVDIHKRQVTYKGNEVTLTRTEFSLLVYLLSNQSNVLTHDQILEKVWGTDYVGSHHVLRVCINRLRNKFADANALSLEALSGVGYRLRKAA